MYIIHNIIRVNIIIFIIKKLNLISIVLVECIVFLPVTVFEFGMRASMPSRDKAEINKIILDFNF